MQKSSKLLFVSLILLFATSIAYSGEYSPAFPEYLAEHQNDDMVSAIITMSDQVNLRALQDDLYARRADRREWHEVVVRALQEKATLTQADIIARLDQMGASGMVSKYKSLWIGNIIVVSATREALDELVSRDDVARISPDYYIEQIEPVSKGGDEPTIAGHEIGLERIHADQCWAMGITGDGRMVSHLDTGVDGNHPALNARWRGYDDRYSSNPEWAWFDPVTNTNFPFDSGAHGTHTMGTMCGLGEGTGDTVGVAFGAQWISAGVIDRVSIPRTVQDALAAFEWITDPDLDPGTVWDVPDVCSNSWGLMTGHGYPPCDETFWVVLDGCEAAGVVVVFAAGNEGPGSYSLRRPADRATTDLTSFSVGAVDGNNQNLPIADFSSRGPSNCTPNGDDTFKPEVSAPGVNVRSSVPGGGYQGGWSGTSMACPHVAGVVALMRQANPNLTSEEIRQIFLDTATDYGDPGEDNDYGMGVINAYDAVLVAISRLQGWGTQGGFITDQASGNPIQGATLSVQGRPWHATSRANGEYYLTVPADTAWIIRVDHSPVHLPVFDTITVVESDTIFQNYVLEGKVPVTLTASFGNPVDASYRSFYFKGSWNSDGFWDNSWSAPLIEVKDDGVFPDQTANDGVFTGRLLLARDLAHTYSWAIYSENYGGDSARLQYGADFSIPDLNPPTVPTLSVNPCSVDHNWNISVYANGGALQLDLHRGFNSNPQKWGAAESLFAGNTYTFFFRPMHCDIGQYGVGGVGGVAIIFDCTFTGPYEFIFDDRDDSGIVQLVGTEGPPVFLSARSGLDGHIPVAWLPPGTLESQELFYDDGVLVNGYYYYAYDNLMAEMFEPAEHPVVIDSVVIHLLTEGDPFWPWPDGQHDPVGISIFLDDGNGNPDPNPVFYTEATCNLGEWLRVDVEDIAVESGNFWVAVNNLSGGGEDGLGLDAYTDYPGNKWAREGGSWMLQDYYTGDHMIRSKVFGGGRAAWMGYDAGIAGEVNLNVPVASHPELVGGSGHANEVLSAAKSQGVNRMAYHPKASPVHPPMILDQEVDGYRLYRSTSPHPYSGGEGNLVNCLAIPGDMITETHYDDWCRCNNVDSIQNGVLYYYEASAIYGVGGGAYIEIGPSNQDTAMAENHPPANPTNLIGSSLGNDVNLTWNRNTDYDIASYRVFRRDYNQQNFNLVGTVVHPDTTFHDVITIDGIYRYKIAAVDDGDMQSTGFSNSVDIPIGPIPPRNLQATTDEEFQISLRWQHPGGGGGGDLTVLVIAADEAGMFIGELLGFDDVVQVDYFDARSGTPDLDFLSTYNVVIVWSNYVFSDPFGMGDVLADYVDAGGGVVLQQFSFGSGWGLAGRLMDEYASFSQGPIGYQTKCLGEYDPAHPIMEGVTTVCDLYSSTVSVVNNGELVASYEDGTPFVGVSPDVNVVCVNGYIGDARQFTGDMIILVHNALNFATGGAEVIPQNYILYKSDSPSGPFDPLDTLPGEQRAYVDAPVPNGIDYWYRLTAVYPGPIESDPSNIAQGRAQNHPPQPPFNLHGSVNNRDVTLQWSFTNTMGDWHHFNIYKKIVPGGTFTFVASVFDSTAIVNIPPGQDGVWAFVVTAVDNGTPQLESGNSNQVFFPVGNLPPVNLRATSNMEGYVPLHWSEPGIRPTVTIAYDDGALMNGYYYYAYENLMANQFIVAPPVEVDTLWVHVLTEGDPYWPWPDGQHDPVAISVFDDDGGGNPGDQVFYTEVTCELGQWIIVPIEGGLQLNGPNFWIAFGNLAGGGEDGMGIDAFTDYPEYKWALEGGSWFNQDYYPGDHMIRATVIDNGRSILLSEKSPTMDLALANGEPVDDMRATASKSTPVAPSIASVTGGINIDNPRPLDIEVDGYNVYRALAPNVPVDPGHRVRNWQVQPGTAWNDSGVVNGTTYYYVVTALYNAGADESPPSNEVSATPRVGGRMVLNPLSFNVSGMPGHIGSANLNIANPGGLDLNFGIAAQTDQRGRSSNVHNNWTFEAMHRTRHHQSDKSNLPQEPTNPPMLLGRGGPDEFGYMWIDSDEPGGPTYSWVDIEGRGQNLYMYDDDNQGPFDLGFDFPFYGNIFNSFRICANGWISFTSDLYYYYNYPLPDPFNAPPNFIGGFWDDLNPSDGGQVIVYSSSDSAVVSWIGVPHYYSGGPYTFQIILTPNGVISTNYMDIGYPDDSNTIGIQNGDGSIGLQVCFDQVYVHNDLTIRFTSGWLSADPAAGIVAPGGNSNVSIIFDASFLDLGVYTGTLIVTGTDMNHQVGVVNIPVTFHVVPDVVDEPSDNLPKEFALSQNYPNPFNPTTEIEFALPVNSRVSLDVFNVLGQKVRTLVNGDMEAGYKSVVWDGTDNAGASVASGTYFYVLKTGDKTFTKKMTMLK